VKWRDVSVLLTGDIGRNVERGLASAIPRAPIRIIKVPHHGSLTSSTPELIRALAPQVAVVSAGRANHFGHPVPEVLERYRQAGAEVRPRATVTRVLTNPQGSKVTGIEYYDEKKERQVQEANVVVLAAWSAQNPRIMLNSATDKHAKGLANSSGLLGKYMMAHFSSGTWAMFDEDVQNHLGTVGAQFMSYDRADKTSHKGALGSTFINVGAALKASGLGGFAGARADLFGPALAEFMKRGKRGLSRIGASGEEMPNIENRVELASDKDEFGMPLGKIIHSYDQDAAAVWDANYAEGLKIAKAAGARYVTWPCNATLARDCFRTPPLDDLLRQLQIEPLPPARRIRLCLGGPVDNGRGFVLHTADWTGEGSLVVNERLALTASLDVLKAIATGGGPREGLLALGYVESAIGPVAIGGLRDAFGSYEIGWLLVLGLALVLIAAAFTGLVYRLAE